MIEFEVLFFINLFTFILSLVKYVNGDEKVSALGILSFIFQIFLIIMCSGCIFRLVCDSSLD